jgi:predicted dehydrogenase
MDNTRQTVKAAIIGVSGFGNVHYHDLMRQVEQGHMALVGATVINQDEEADKCARLRSLGTEIFTDYGEMLERLRGQIDLCFIPTGIHLHAPMTIAALQAGANVFVEKPAAATINEVRAMQTAERETERFVAVGFQTMYALETLLMKRLILNGDLGRIEAIKCRGLWPRLDSYYARNRWAGRLKLNGQWVLDSPFNNAMAHQLNMICFLAGTELHRAATLERIEAELYHAHDIESADTACMRILTAQNVPLYFLVTHCSEGLLNPEIVVRGDRGQLHWTFNRLRIAMADGSVEEVACQTGTELRDAMMAALRARLEDPEVFICGLDVAGVHTLAVNGAHLSSAAHPVPEAFIQRYPHEGSVKTVIEDIDDIIGRAFNEEKLFSDLRVPWAQRARVVALTNAEHFGSR